MIGSVGLSKTILRQHYTANLTFNSRETSKSGKKFLCSLAIVLLFLIMGYDFLYWSPIFLRTSLYGA